LPVRRRDLRTGTPRAPARRRGPAGQQSTQRPLARTPASPAPRAGTTSGPGRRDAAALQSGLADQAVGAERAAPALGPRLEASLPDPGRDLVTGPSTFGQQLVRRGQLNPPPVAQVDDLQLQRIES